MAPIIEEFPTWEAALEARPLGLGASDAASACGVGRRSGLDLFLEKRGLAVRGEPSIRMQVGKMLEPLLLKLYREKNPHEDVEPWPQTRMIRSRIYPWMTCTPDAYSDTGRLVEFKTADSKDEWGEPGSDQIPLHYLIQVHHQIIVADRTLVDVGVLFRWGQFEVYPIEYNHDLAETIIAREREFWGYVERCEPPPEECPTPLQLAKLNPECEGEVELDGDVQEWIGGYLQQCENMKNAELRRDQCKSHILQAMGNHKIGRLSSGANVRRFVERHAARVQSVKEHTRHYFRVCGPREEG